MVALTTVVAVAVVCAVVVIVGIVVGTVVWVKKRQDRLSLAFVNARQGRYGLQNFPVETLTELSREEGSRLRQHGQLPYGKPSEWGVLKSHESLVSPVESEPGHFSEKKALRRSFSWSKSKRHLQNPLRPRVSSLAPLTESNKEHLSPKRVPEPREKIPLSAVEGVLELPTETTPRHTPERDDDRLMVVDPTIRPISSDWPVYHARERSGSLFPVLEDCFEGYGDHRSRPRGGSITLQTPGDAPAQPAPPPPCAYPPNRFRLSKNDSIRFSTLSLETADSSILDDSRRTSAGLESNFASPSLPPCPTFTPYSANDVGRIEYDRRSLASLAPAFPAPFIFPAVSPSRDAQRLDGSRAISPRRSQTARSPSHSVERISPPPRRSESLQSRRDARSSSQYSPPIHVAPLNVPNRDSLVPYLSQARHSLHGSQRRSSSNQDPFLSAVTSIPPHMAARRSNNSLIQEAAHIAANGNIKPPLTSALKGGSGPRKGHKRQNCVRISIHPPITFGGPTFSPMVEEPEECDDLGGRQRSAVSHLSAPDLPHNDSLNSSVSSLSMGTSSSQDLYYYSYYNQQQQQQQQSQRPRPSRRESDIPPASRSSSYRDPARRKRHRRTQSADDMATRSLSNRSTQSLQIGSTIKKSLPELLTHALPPPTTSVMEASLSSTPSPEKKPPPVWMGPPSYASSPTTHENMSPGSPRRSAVKGPRSQPGKPGRTGVRAMAQEYETKSSTEPTNSGDTVWRPPPSASDQSPGRRKTKRTPAPISTDSVNRTRSTGAPSPMPPPAYQPYNPMPPHPIEQAHQNGDGQPYSELSSHEDTQTGRQIVPIWEDRKLERHPTTKSTVSVVSQIDGPAELQGDVSPQHLNRNRSWKARPFTTPTKKAVGLGIGAMTPGSLYDVDGFLKE